jgi:HD superfamily phosphohydrolase YqeK
VAERVTLPRATYVSSSLSPPTELAGAVHDIVTQAAEGTLPDWAVADDARRAHMTRVAELLESWAGELGLPDEERRRWRSLGYFHDALRDADPAELRPRVPPAFQDWPDPLLHGPAVAERLRMEGVDDGELLLAVAFHTVGDPRLGRMGRALYAADFLEPGRTFLPDWREQLRRRMPDALDHVVREIARARIGNLLDRRAPVLPRTIDFWNRLVEEAP